MMPFYYHNFTVSVLRVIKKLAAGIFVLVLVGLILPQRFVIPVEGATKSSYNEDSFWYYPWGKSVTHKGIDIFANEGTLVHSSTNGIVISCEKTNMGGNTISILGPKWRLHYYAHLQTIKISNLSCIKAGTIIGTVGTTGNAAGKPPHLHYSISTLIPYFWRIDGSQQGWKKMFYLNPSSYFR